MRVSFNRDDTKMIKGIAIVLMLMHHLFFFPDNIITADQIIPLIYINFANYHIPLIELIGSYGKICVSLFMFLGGYGTCIQYKKRGTFIFLPQKLMQIYLEYWKIFLIFVPISFLFFHKQPDYCINVSNCHLYNQFDLKTFFEAFMAWSMPYNHEWWFIQTYIAVIIGFPVIWFFINRNSIRNNVCSLILLSIGVEYIVTVTKMQNLMIIHDRGPFVLCFLCGVMFETKDLLNKMLNFIYEYKSRFIYMLGIIMLVLIVFTRYAVHYNTMDIIYCPLICIVCKLDLEGGNLFRILKTLGKSSTNIWLIHTFFCYYWFNVCHIVLYSRNAIVDFLMLLSLSWISSVIISKMYSNFFKKIHLISDKD